MFDAFHLSLGVISVAIVYIWTKPVLSKSKPSSFSRIIHQIIQFELFSFWLLKEIVVANIQVLKVSLSPRMKDLIDPRMIRFKAGSQSESLQFVLGQSITLTPGTVTTRIKDDEFLVHALTKDAADALPGEMQERVCRIFKEGGK